MPLALRLPSTTALDSRSVFQTRIARHRNTMRLYIAAAAAETEPTNNNEKFTSTVIPLAARADVPQFIWCAGVFLVLVTIWTGLRVYSRRIRRLPLAMEDALYHISVASIPAGSWAGIRRSGAGSFAHVSTPLDFLLRLRCGPVLRSVGYNHVFYSWAHVDLCHCSTVPWGSGTSHE